MNRIEIDGLTFEIDVDKDECHTVCVVGCDKSAEAVTIPSLIPSPPSEPLLSLTAPRWRKSSSPIQSPPSEKRLSKAVPR